MKKLFTLLLVALHLSIYSQTPELIINIDGFAGTSIQPFVKAAEVFDGRLFFDGANELWATDATEAGSMLVKDIYPGPFGGSGCQNFYDIGDYLLMTASDGTNGTELWRTDGTEAGTVMVKDINPGSASGIPSSATQYDEFYVWNNVLYFTADNGVNGAELWRSDGTENGTYLLYEFNMNGGVGSINTPSHFAEYNGKLYFSSAGGGFNGNGKELWVTDGTTDGTMEVKDIYDGFLPSYPSDLIVCNGYLLFIATSSGFGYELWRSDGTMDGTEIVADINPGGFSGLVTSTSLKENKLVKIGEVVYFAADDGTNGVELWRSDGTEAGTFMVKDAMTSGGYAPRNFTVVNGLLIYEYDDGQSGRELWRSDGTEIGTTMIKDVAAGSDGSFNFQSIAYSFNGKAFYTLDDKTSAGTELWQTDGTENGTFMVADINPGSASSAPFQFIGYNDYLVFAADHVDYGKELWKLQVELVVLLSGELSIQHGIDCFGDTTGELDAEVLGGVTPYTYTWSVGTLSGANPTNLPAGIYTVTVTDNNGVELVLQRELFSPTELTAVTSFEPEVVGNDGSASILPDGGTPPYSYLWSTNPPATTSEITGLVQGEYTVTVTDANGCELVETIVVDYVDTDEPFANAFLVAPTVANSSFSIFSDQPVFDMKVSIFDRVGRVAKHWEKVNTQQELNISEIPDGMYFTVVKWQGKQLVKKLVIRH